VRAVVVLSTSIIVATSGLCTEEYEGDARPTREPDVIFVPTPHEVVDWMLHLAKVEENDVVYDLGCGDGRIVVAAARKYGCKAVGYDIDPERVMESIGNVRKNRVGHLVTIEEKDIFTLDLSGASVITLYLLPELNVRLIPQLEKLKPGSRIVSYDFDMKGVRPDASLTVFLDEEEHTVWLWTTPLKKVPVDDEEADPFDWLDREEEEPAQDPLTGEAPGAWASVGR
jgi:SAM-dependent methyltransferase